MTWEIPGQEQVAELLAGAVGRGEVGHAWAFVGPPGVGQETAARTLAAALSCPEPDPPCGRCGVCERMLRAAHPDYWEFVPVGAAHRVSDVRERWLPVATRSSTEGGWKVLRIVDADRLNETAANAFLKGLEEPPAQTLWILDVADPQELPDTILSRCREVRFRPWDEAALAAEAQRLGLDDPEDRSLAVRASLGSSQLLRRLASDGALEDLRAHRSIPQRLREDGPGFSLVAWKQLEEEIKRRTSALKEAAKRELAELADSYGDDIPRAVAREAEERATRREREVRTRVAQAAIEDLTGWYRDCLLVAAGGPVAEAIHRDAAGELAADAEALGARGVLAAVDLCQAALEDLELTVNLQLRLEALFMELSALSRR
jgi:DNA polymerase III subunit delta'